MIRATVALIALIALAAPTMATAQPEANVIAVNFNGGSTVDMVVAIPKGIDNAARNGNADFGLSVSATYVSQNGTVETLFSGRVSIADTPFFFGIDEHTVAVGVSLPIGATPAPGPNPSFSATAELLTPGDA